MWQHFRGIFKKVQKGSLQQGRGRGINKVNWLGEEGIADRISGGCKHKKRRKRGISIFKKDLQIDRSTGE